MAKNQKQDDDAEMSENGGDEKYKVGYGRPPKSTQFKKGCSGNRKGRPAGSKNFHTLIDKVLEQKVVVTENGKAIKATKKELIAIQLANKAVSGDLKAASVALPHILASEEKKEERAKKLASFNKDDDAIIKMYMKKQQEKEI